MKLLMDEKSKCVFFFAESDEERDVLRTVYRSLTGFFPGPDSRGLNAELCEDAGLGQNETCLILEDNTR